MKMKNFWIRFWVRLRIVGILLIVVPIVSAIITATGAFGSDPSEPVNKVDFAWALLGLAIIALSFYRIRQVGK